MSAAGLPRLSLRKACAKDWCVDGECVLPFSRGAAVTININGEEFCKFRNRRTYLFLWPNLNCHGVLEMSTNCPVCLPTWGPDWPGPIQMTSKDRSMLPTAHHAININDQVDLVCASSQSFFLFCCI